MFFVILSAIGGLSACVVTTCRFTVVAGTAGFVAYSLWAPDCDAG